MRLAALSVLLSACVGGEPAVPGEDASDDVKIVVKTDAGGDATVVNDEPDSGDAAINPGDDSAADAMTGPLCPSTDIECSGACVPNDPRNCGACGHDCTNLPNVTGAVTCVSGVCTFAPSACTAGFAHCAANPDLGCETSITTTSNCGMCGNACGTGTPLCAGTGSTYACASGCPATAPTLCGNNTCVNTTSDAQNCGGCTKPCTTSVAHAQATCASSQCGFACTASYPDPCAGGCANFSNDNSNCGTCGHACTGGMTCQASGCACPGGTHNCGGTCMSNSSTASCGTTSCSACAVPANGSATCNGTACGIGCNTNYNACGTSCVDETQNGNCGGCGISCPVSCTGSKCTKAIGIAAGAGHTCALLSNGTTSSNTVECWGNNVYGQLGYATTLSYSPSPKAVPNITGVTAVAAGDYTTCVLLAGGTVKCWGLNTWGELGVAPGGSCSQSSPCFTMAPVTVPLTGAAIAVASGYESSCAILSDGTVECWGANGSGQLGNNSFTASPTPVPVSGLTNAIAIAVGELHACALRSDHTAVCWGDNSADELGSSQQVCDPPMSDYCAKTYVQVSGITDATALAAAAISTCVLVGVDVQCWGYLQQGLGDQMATAESSFPITVANVNSATGVAVGDLASCALLSGGSAMCWGGEPLGNGMNVSSSTAVPVSNLTGATAIAIGQQHRCALLSTGTVACWSDNTYGQLGNGTTNPSLVPTPVVW